MPVRIITTGGTFEKRYDPIAGQLAFGESHLPEILVRARAGAEVAIETAMLIDSLEMTDADRAQILDRCRSCPEQRIVIVHGTDTMVETARVIAQADLARTVVLTGAMVPYDLRDSDALFNLGYALACANTLAPGVWVAMNAAVHPWDQVRKDREKGRFVPV